MTKFSRFSTSTIVASNGIVPWLAAQGPLAYSPVEPPAGDYFFQYSWILPESEVKIINPSRVSLVEAVGCQVEFIPPAERTTT